MGYCYEGKKLCCDECSTAGSRKVKCPYNYCPAAALCPTCRKDPALKAKVKAYHETNCKGASAWYAREKQEERGLMMAGWFVRCSAFGPEGHVHVIFKSFNDAGETIYMGAYMSQETYQLPGRNLTIQDYERRAIELGHEMREAPTEFDYSRPTKQVTAKEFMAAVGLTDAALAVINQKMLAEEN